MRGFSLRWLPILSADAGVIADADTQPLRDLNSAGGHVVNISASDGGMHPYGCALVHLEGRRAYPLVSTAKDA